MRKEVPVEQGAQFEVDGVRYRVVAVNDDGAIVIKREGVTVDVPTARLGIVTGA